MSQQQKRESGRRNARRHYVANREEILERQHQRRRDPVSGEEIRQRERERQSALPEAEREKQRVLARDRYRRNPRSREENAQAHMRFRYGMTADQRAQMLAEQEGCCYLCNEPLPAESRKIHVDHDHSCCRGNRSCGACVRGLACEPCNTGIGQFGDDPERMRRVADSLEMATRRLRETRPIRANQAGSNALAGESE